MTPDSDDARSPAKNPSPPSLIGFGLLFAIGFVILLASGRTAFAYFAGTLESPFPTIRLGIAVTFVWIGSTCLLAGLYGPIRIAVARTVG